MVLRHCGRGPLALLAGDSLHLGSRKPAPAASASGPPPLTIAEGEKRSSGWLTDLQSASRAADDGRDILIEFASARDGPARLETLVHDPAFAPLGQRYVLVRLDVTSSQGDPQTVEKTAEWIDKLNLTELPCLVAFDSAFRPFGAIEGGDMTSVAGLLARLGALEDAKAHRDADLSAAAKASGLQRAMHLDRALEDVGPLAELGYPEVMRQIVELDSSGVAGLKGRYAARVSDQIVDERVQHVVYPLVDAGDLRGALEQARQLEHGVATTVAQRQLLRAFQAQLYSSLGQKQRALETMDGAIALDPSTDAATRVRDAKAKLEQLR